MIENNNLLKRELVKYIFIEASEIYFYRLGQCVYKHIGLGFEDKNAEKYGN